MLVFSLGVALLAQSVAAETELLSVNLNIDGRDFGIKFPSTLSANAVAQQFCSEQAGTLGLAAETLQNCVNPVEKFLLSAISDETRRKAVQNLSGRQITIKLRANEKDYEITFQPSAVSIDGVANAFCSEKGEELGVTQESFTECVRQISDYVMRELQLFVSESSTQASSQSRGPSAGAMRLPLKIGEKEFAVEFLPQEVTPQQVATQFCIEQGRSLGFTEENIQECVNPVAAYLARAIEERIKGLEAAKPKEFQVIIVEQ